MSDAHSQQVYDQSYAPEHQSITKEQVIDNVLLKVELIPRFVGEELERRKSACFDFDMTEVLARYVRDTGVDEAKAKLHERELKRFLFLITAYSNTFQMRGPIDELWHTFIMFSVPYFKFSRITLGNYIHHFPEPLDKPSEAQKKIGAQQYKLTWDAYRLLYGEYPVKDCWPQIFKIKSDIITEISIEDSNSTCQMCDGINCGIGNCSDTLGCFFGPPCTN